LFEAKGWLDRAESEYQKALAIDPDYEKAHTNLALLYERKGELEKAAFHWMRRYKLGAPNDPWTYEARQRLEKLGLVDLTEEKPSRPKPETAIEREELETSPRKAQEKEDSSWTRLGKKEALEIETKAPIPKKVKKKTKEEKKEEAEKIEKKPEPKKTEKRKIETLKESRIEPVPKTKEAQKKSGGEWTRINFGPKEKEKPLKLSGARTANLDKELQESLKLAEQRLREGKEKGKAQKEGEKKAPVKISAKPKEPTARQKISTSSAKTYYAKAQDYYNKGEWTKALDTIREAKKDYPEDLGLLELEQSIKNKMKEERIQDHYNEGIMHYRQEDYSGARKEFEAILNILPE
jgi:tetratricopeptide (TPR) repeat protein